MRGGLSMGIVAGEIQRSSVPALIAHAVNNPGNFVEPVTIGSTNTSGANFIAVVFSCYDTGIGDNRIGPLFADLVGGTVSNSTFAATSITQSGSNMTLNGTFPGGGSNAYAGSNFMVQVDNTSGGFPALNAGTFPCTASTTTTITLTNASGVNDASAYRAIITQNIWHYLIRVTDYGNVGMFYTYNAVCGSGHTFIMNTQNLGGDGGAFAIQAWSGIKSSGDPIVPGSYLYTRGSNGTTDSPGLIQTASLSGSALTITGEWSILDYSPLVGNTVTLSGFTGSSSANNGTWVVTLSNTSQLTLTVPGGFNGIAGTPTLSIDPPSANSLIITGLGGRNNYGTKSIDTGFTITDAYNGSGQFASASMAYLLSAGATGQTPFWTTATSTINMDMNIASFQHA